MSKEIVGKSPEKSQEKASEMSGETQGEVSQNQEKIAEILGYVSGYSFVEIDDLGIFINTSKMNSRQDFIKFIDHIFKGGLYFVNLDYSEFSKLVYNFSNFKGEKIKIGDSISIISDERSKKYLSPSILSDGKASYTFSQLYDEIEEDGKVKEVKVILDIDEFVSCMWSYGIKYGLQIDEIKDMISNGKTGNITIAKPLPPEESQDAYLETLENFVPDKGLKSQGNTRVDIKTYNMTYPQVKSQTLLYKKFNPVRGNYGMTIYGDEIMSREPKDISMNDFVGEGVRVEEKEGVLYYISDITGYVTSLGADSYGINIDNKGQKKLLSDIKRKLEVTTTLTISCSVGTKTGNIYAVGDVVCPGVEYGYELTGDNVTSNGDVAGNIFAINDVTINGNVVGGQHTDKLDNGGTKTVFDGQVKSTNGNIKVNGRVLSRASLEALKGEVSAEQVEASFIAGKNVKLKSVRNSMIIGENIEITEDMRDCLIICTNNLSVKSASSSKGQENQGNIVLIIKPEDYEGKLRKIGETMKKLQEISANNSSLISSIQETNSSIKGDKNIKIFTTINSKVRNRQALTQQEQTIYDKYLNWFQEQLAKFMANENKMKELKAGLDKVNQDLGTLSIAFEKLNQQQSQQINPQISVELNQSTLKMMYLLIPNYVNFDSLGMDVIEQLKKYKEFIKTGIFLLEPIKILPSGPNISWSKLEK